jgi:hypothetical protein
VVRVDVGVRCGLTALEVEAVQRQRKDASRTLISFAVVHAVSPTVAMALTISTDGPMVSIGGVVGT